MHFTARNDRYPQFSFCVPALRPLLLKKGRDKDSVIVRFADRVLDTQAQGYTPQEAALIKAQLEKLVDTHVTIDFSDDQTEDRGVTVQASIAPLPVKTKEIH
jgi:hypothetical protein